MKTYGTENPPEFYADQIIRELSVYFNNFGISNGFIKILAKISELDRQESTDEIAKLVFKYFERDLKNHLSIANYEEAVINGKEN